MSININRPIVQTLTLKMLSGKTRLLGIPKNRIQVVMTLPDITEFNEKLYEAIEFFRHKAESFIITSSSQEQCNELIEEYELRENLISTQYKDFAKIFNIKEKNGDLKKSLMIIDINCQITHKDIL